MKTIINQTKGASSMLRRFLAGVSLLAFTTASVLAQEASIETEATAMIDDAKSAATTVLIAAIGILAAFVLFKLVRRAVNKA